MQNIADKEKVLIGNRVKFIRSKLNISIRELAESVYLSEGNIKGIEAGKASSIDNIIKTIYFLGLVLKDASDPNYIVPTEPELRKRIITFHKKHSISDRNNLLKKEPSINVILTDRLLPQGYLNAPTSIATLVEICKIEYNIEISSSSLSNAIKKLVAQRILVVTNPKDKYYLYKKRK